MALEYFGINRGQHETDVVVQGSAPSTDVYVAVNLSNFSGDAGQGRQKVMDLLTLIMNQVMKGKWPPA